MADVLKKCCNIIIAAVPLAQVLTPSVVGWLVGCRWEEGMADVWKLLDELDQEADFRCAQQDCVELLAAPTLNCLHNPH
jgi:hypothetical protein